MAPLQWSDLTLDEQIAVRDSELTKMLASLIEFGPKFLPPELRPNFIQANDNAERMRTPWFLHEYLMDDPAIKSYLEAVTDDWVRSAIYVVAGEHIIDIPIIKK